MSARSTRCTAGSKSRRAATAANAFRANSSFETLEKCCGRASRRSLHRSWRIVVAGQGDSMQNALVEPTRAPRPSHVSSYLQHHRRELLGLLDSGASGAAFARRHAQVMDGLVDSLFKAALGALPLADRVPVVLGAV